MKKSQKNSTDKRAVKKRALAVLLSAAVIVSGLSIGGRATVQAEDEEQTPLLTHTFDDETEKSGIVNMNADSNKSTITYDADRGKVLSLGEGTSSEQINGIVVTNPFATVETTQETINAHFDEAMSRAKGLTYDLDAPAESVTDYSTFDSVKAAIKEVGAATPIKDSDGNYIKATDGQTAKVSAYNSEKEYPVPIWNAEDGVTISLWVNIPENADRDAVLFEFYNDNYLKRSGVEKNVSTFLNTTGHFKFTAGGDLEFEELSMGAVGQDNNGNYKYATGLEGSRNLFEASSIGETEAVRPLDKKGQWVCVTLVCENDYVTVYYDGEPVTYTEEHITDYEVGENGFVQTKDPVTDYNWTRVDMATYSQAFNGYFGSRNTPAFQRVNKGVYAKFPAFADYADNFSQNYSYKSQLRISLVDWLKDADTVLYIGGAAQKDLSYWLQGTSFIYSNDYTAVEGTKIDDMSFYAKALTAEEVKAAYETEKDKDITETEEPTTEEPATEEPATEEPATEEPTTEEPATEEPTTEEPTTEEPVTEEPTTEEPVTEEPATETPATETPDYLYGDVNRNEKITADDALFALKYVVKLEELSDFQHILADVNGDGDVTAADALLILQKVVKLIDTFPVEE